MKLQRSCNSLCEDFLVQDFDRMQSMLLPPVQQALKDSFGSQVSDPDKRKILADLTSYASQVIAIAFKALQRTGTMTTKSLQSEQRGIDVGQCRRATSEGIFNFSMTSQAFPIALPMCGLGDTAQSSLFCGMRQAPMTADDTLPPQGMTL